LRNLLLEIISINSTYWDKTKKRLLAPFVLINLIELTS